MPWHHAVHRRRGRPNAAVPSSTYNKKRNLLGHGSGRSPTALAEVRTSIASSDPTVAACQPRSAHLRLWLRLRLRLRRPRGGGTGRPPGRTVPSLCRRGPPPIPPLPACSSAGGSLPVQKLGGWLPEGTSRGLNWLTGPTSLGARPVECALPLLQSDALLPICSAESLPALAPAACGAGCIQATHLHLAEVSSPPAPKASGVRTEKSAMWVGGLNRK